MLAPLRTSLSGLIVRVSAAHSRAARADASAFAAFVLDERAQPQREVQRPRRGFQARQLLAGVDVRERVVERAALEARHRAREPEPDREPLVPVREHA